MNNNIVLISGESSTGKSFSLKNITNPEGVLYLNFEANKPLPFRNPGFKQISISNPDNVFQELVNAEKDNTIHTIVFDTLTFMLDRYASLNVIHADNVLTAWGAYAEFWKNLMQRYVGNSKKNYIFLGHTTQIYNEQTMGNEYKVKVQGQLMTRGIESWFTTVVSTKIISIEDLTPNEFLNITKEDELNGVKHVFQTRITADTLNEKMRSPYGLWTPEQTFIDNDISIVLGQLHKYYN